MTRLVGGPHDGRIADTSGEVPAFLLSQPIESTLLDLPIQTACWNPVREWYEVLHTPGDAAKMGDVC